MSRRKLYQNSFVYVLLGFLGPAVNFFLIPIYTKNLQPAEFGIITLATILTLFLCNFSGLGISGAFSRYYFDMNSEERERSLLTVSLVIQGIAGLVTHGIFLIVGDFLLDLIFTTAEFSYSKYGIYIGITVIAMNVQTMILLFFRNRENIKVYAFWAILFFLCQATGIFVGIVVYHLGALGNVAGRMVGAVIPLMLFLVVRFRLFTLKINLRHIGYQLLAYGAPLVPYLLINMGFNNIDKVLLEKYGNLSLLGLYGFAYMIMSVSEIFINALQSSTYPSLFRELSSDRPNRTVIQNVYVMFVLANLGIITLLAGFSTTVIHFFIDKKYQEVISFLPCLILVAIPRTFSIIYSNTLFYYKKTKVMPLASVVSFAVALLSGVILLPLIHVWGIIIAVFLSQCSQLLLFLFFNMKFKILIPESTNIRREILLAVCLVGFVLVSTYVYNIYVQNYAIYLIAALGELILLFVFYKGTFQMLVGKLVALMKKH